MQRTFYHDSMEHMYQLQPLNDCFEATLSQSTFAIMYTNMHILATQIRRLCSLQMRTIFLNNGTETCLIKSSDYKIVVKCTSLPCASLLHCKSSGNTTHLEHPEVPEAVVSIALTPGQIAWRQLPS